METLKIDFFQYGLNQVLTVPMRNGNEAALKEDATELLVLTVPMRNGNFEFQMAVKVVPNTFLPYL